jgi:hypothetical protein
VAAVASLEVYDRDEEPTVAAMRDGRPQFQKKKQRDPKKTAAAMAEMEPELSRSARLASGMCISHWRFGAKAHSCIRPCSWAGNVQAGGN